MICEIRDYNALKQILMSHLWTIVVRGGPWEETSWFIKVRSGISFTYSNSGNFFRKKIAKMKTTKNRKTKKEREDVN